MFNDIEKQMLIKASSGLHAETFHALDIEEQEQQMAKLDKVIGTLIKKNPNNFTGETVANFYKTQRK
jgi:tRNA U34 5-carboxymethylaminomethyl modifying GTPase MnmE/TrmE